MKKQIGFIDLFIDEWHANNYPAWFRMAALSNEFELGYAWEERSLPGGRNLADWCAEFGMKPASSLSEVVAKSDALCVLAPSNPEVHEALAELALKSGKPVYIDKPFAPNRAAAERMFALAREYNTPMWSSSALRFGDEFQKICGEWRKKNVVLAQASGCGSNFPEYAIHQLEMVVATLGAGALEVRNISQAGTPALQIEVKYPDARQALLTYHAELPFGITLFDKQSTVKVQDMSGMFENLCSEILKFFATGVSPVNPAETLEIASLLAAVIQAEQQPGVWLPV